MNKNQYGWFGSHFCVSQVAGFFIDESDRILFWPNGKNAGYVVKEPQVWGYFKMRFSIANHADRAKKRYGWLALFSLIIFVILYMMYLHLTALLSLVIFGISFFYI